ncbi:MAG: hypothetical protein Q8R92_10065, partial [Deltaproteobacteria bacterium]|nr:hypothetical protein [Deltaproteobacteria bacterium]
VQAAALIVGDAGGEVSMPWHNAERTKYGGPLFNALNITLGQLPGCWVTKDTLESTMREALKKPGLISLRRAAK